MIWSKNKLNMVSMGLNTLVLKGVPFNGFSLSSNFFEQYTVHYSPQWIKYTGNLSVTTGPKTGKNTIQN